MDTQKLGFLIPTRKATSLESKRKTIRNDFILSDTHNKRKIKNKIQEYGFHIPIQQNKFSIKKVTKSLSKKNSIQNKVNMPTMYIYDKIQNMSKQLNNQKKSHILHQMQTYRIYTEKSPEKFNLTVRRTSPKRSIKKVIHTTQSINNKKQRNQTQNQKHIDPLKTEYLKKKIILTQYQLQEASFYEKIYYIGNRRQDPKDIQNYFDDQDGDLKVCLQDHFQYRYQVLGILGKGSFGQVFKVFDHKKKVVVALKVIKNRLKFYKQAQVQIKLLFYILEKDINKRANVIEPYQTFVFRQHVCITFELLHINLYDFLKFNNFTGFTLDLIRRFIIQILQGLLFFQKHKIVHCDLKPENILLKQQNKSGIKIIDLGSSCFQQQKIYTYIQSRFYRAPQIILGVEYTTAIDMWSLGCIIYEFYSGFPLFPGENQMQQMAMFTEILGIPPVELLNKSQRRKKFFEDNNVDIKFGHIKDNKGRLRKPNNKSLDKLLHRCKQKDFIEFIKLCIEWDPEKRLKASEALIHPWILKGLPEQICEQHIKQMKEEAPQLFS